MKKYVCIVLAMLMVFGLAACSPAGETVTETVPASAEANETASAEATESEVEYEEVTLTMQELGSQESDQAQKLTEILKQIEETTGGKVKIDMYWNATLYTQDQQTTSCMAGNVDLIVIQPSVIAEYYDKLGMVSSPYFWKSLEHWEAFYASDTWATMNAEIADQTNMRVLTQFNKCGRCMHLNLDRKITSRADLADIKLRVPNTEAMINMGIALGVNPVALAANETYLAIQTGTVDGQENPIGNSIVLKFEEVAKSVTLTNHMFLEDMIAINEDTWQSLSPAVQQVLTDAFAEYGAWVQDYNWTNLETNIEYYESLGIKVYELTDEEMASYQQEVTDYYFDNVDTSSWDMDMYNEIQALAD